jgi:hypothetical protein
VGYAVFYPAVEPSRRWWGGGSGRRWTRWLPDPTVEMERGYEKFLGRKGLGWICRWMMYRPLLIPFVSRVVEESC